MVQIHVLIEQLLRAVRYVALICLVGLAGMLAYLLLACVDHEPEVVVVGLVLGGRNTYRLPFRHS